ncbi:hypothetical protein BCR34DRAFT_210887 [Clohesyomyces aquaticus]|uniref:NACHT domain-containing protein n=1 Tax=Clohesyomyces aquaticus TaxID=1231657 RepID=A0A1Y2AAJ4_9PLEO|nr:hypothetical protein BCR34DRAFT_210887 [Clohesyomyces aquaticus]
MTDPLSVAASVAGIISLGIQVTQSLVNFYEAYRGQKSEIAGIAEGLKILLLILEALRDQLSNRKFRGDEEKALLKCIEASIENCEDSIEELQAKIERFGQESSDNIRAAVRSSVRRVAYPFKQSTLQKLNADIDEIASNIKFALAVLQQRDVENMHDDVEVAKAAIELIRATQISSEIRDWLKAPDASIEFNTACNTKHPATGLWLVKGTQFSAWLEQSKSFLWLTGFAGCGKSVLCSTAIQYTLRHRRSNPRVGIASFFFTFRDNSKQDASAMLRALILQLSSQLDNTHPHLSRLHDRYRNASPPTWDLEDCLHQLVQVFDHVYIILDALDESPQDQHRQGLLEALEVIRNWGELGLHLLVTSRDLPDIRDAICGELHVSLDEIVPMKNASIDKDIATFISGYLEKSRDMQKLKPYHDQIERALSKRAKGVFRWVECQFKVLSRCGSKRRLDEALESLPPGLDETYERILLSIDTVSADDARRILTLLCYSKRPMTVPEVIDATAVELGDNPRFNIEARLFGEDAILSAVPGLVEVDVRLGQPSTLRIAHFSVQEYLESPRILKQKVASFSVRKQKAHSEIASICLTYLLEPALSSTSIDEYPLAEYAAKTWPEHFHEGDKRTCDSERQVLELFQNTKGRFKNWVMTWNVDSYWGDNPQGNIPSPVYYASLLGLEVALSALLDATPSTHSSPVRYPQNICELVKAQGGVHGNALQAASLRGHELVVKLLLDKGCQRQRARRTIWQRAPGGFVPRPRASGEDAAR